MQSMIKKTEEYLEILFGDKVQIVSWNESDLLPFYLKNLYKFYLINFLNTKFMLITYEFDNDLRVSEIKKHIKQIKNYSHVNFEVVCAFKTASTYNRRQLIQNNISFIVPHKQLYIPFIGVAFSEWFTEKPLVLSHLSPTGQALFFELISPGKKGHSQREIGNKLGLDKMSISRAFRELEKIGIVHKDKLGRVNKWELTKKSGELWEAIEPYCIDPIFTKVYVSDIPETVSIKLIKAGETALAESTMLGYPPIQTYAIYKKDWKDIKDNFNTVLSEDDSALCIEIWKHKIPILSGKINPLALYLSLKDTHNERLQMSLDELKTNYPWEDIENDQRNKNI